MRIFLLDTFGDEILLHAPNLSPEAGGHYIARLFRPAAVSRPAAAAGHPAASRLYEEHGHLLRVDVYRGPVWSVCRAVHQGSRGGGSCRQNATDRPDVEHNTYQAPAMNYNCTVNKRSSATCAGRARRPGSFRG